MDYNCSENDTRTNAEQTETGDDFCVSFESLRECADALEFDCPHPSTWKWPRPPANHIVYFVGAETGPVKIGWTQQPIKERLKCIQNGSPSRLHVLATVNATRKCESGYHQRFAAFRLHGEWFERCPEIEAEIERLRVGNVTEGM